MYQERNGFPSSGLSFAGSMESESSSSFLSCVCHDVPQFLHTRLLRVIVIFFPRQWITTSGYVWETLLWPQLHDGHFILDHLLLFALCNSESFRLPFAVAIFGGSSSPPFAAMIRHPAKDRRAMIPAAQSSQSLSGR